MKFEVMDTISIIKELENKPLEDGDLEFLDATLTGMGVNHFFAEPNEGDHDDPKLFGEEAYTLYRLYYDEKNASAVNIAMMLMYKKAGYSEVFLAKAMSGHIGRYVKEG